MSSIGRIVLTFLLGPALYAGPVTDPYVKNLTLVGIIYVQSARSKDSSIAVLRENSSGKTRILHQGDSLLEADLELRELGPQHIVLVRGQRQFVLKVDRAAEPAADSIDTESPETTTVVEAGPTSEDAELPSMAEGSPKDLRNLPVQRYEPKLLPESACAGQDCPDSMERLND